MHGLARDGSAHQHHHCGLDDCRHSNERMHGPQQARSITTSGGWFLTIAIRAAAVTNTVRYLNRVPPTCAEVKGEGGGRSCGDAALKRVQHNARFRIAAQQRTELAAQQRMAARRVAAQLGGARGAASGHV